MARRAAKLCVVFQSLWGRWPCSCFDNRVVRGVNEALLGGTLAVLRWMRPSRRLRTCPGSTLARVAPPSSQRCQVSAQIARRRSVVVCLRVSLDLISAASAPRLLLFPAPDTASSPAPVHKAPRQHPPRLLPPDSQRPLTPPQSAYQQPAHRLTMATHGPINGVKVSRAYNSQVYPSSDTYPRPYRIHNLSCVQPFSSAPQTSNRPQSPRACSTQPSTTPTRSSRSLPPRAKAVRRGTSHTPTAKSPEMAPLVSYFRQNSSVLRRTAMTSLSRKSCRTNASRSVHRI